MSRSLLGVDFVEHIERVVDAADTVIAVIGPRWATAPGPDGRLVCRIPTISCAPRSSARSTATTS